MIIKCLSRKSNVDQLIKYVLADTKIEPEKDERKRPIYVPGIRLTDIDKEHLYAERADSILMKEFEEKQKDGNIAKFVQDHILKTGDLETRLPGIVIKQNLRARSISGYVKAFADNEKMRLHARSNNVKAYHHIISFSNLDKGQMTEGMLKDMAEKYISLRGDNSLFVGAVHQNTDSIHIHLIQSGTQFCTGLANRVSRQQFQELKVAMQEYQITKYPQLEKSVVNHSSKSAKNKYMEEKNIKTHEREEDKKALVEFLTATFQQTTSKEQLLSEISNNGHEPYYRNGKLQGIMYEGEIKYRFSTLGFKDQVTALEDKEVSRENGKERETFTKPSAPVESKDPTDLTQAQVYDIGCDDCKKAYDDPEYKSPNSYTDGKFDIDKHFDHAQQEAIKMYGVEYVLENDSLYAEEMERKAKEVQEQTERPETERIQNGQQPQQMVSFTEATRGMDADQVREIQQGLVNRNMEFEQEHGISRDSQPQKENEVADIGMDRTFYDKMCDDCKQELDDPTYKNPKYYINGELDMDKYHNHALEEFLSVNDVDTVANSIVNHYEAMDQSGNASLDNDTRADEQEDRREQDRIDNDLRELDDLRNGRDRDREEELDRDDDDLER